MCVAFLVIYLLAFCFELYFLLSSSWNFIFGLTRRFVFFVIACVAFVVGVCCVVCAYGYAFVF